MRVTDRTYHVFTSTSHHDAYAITPAVSAVDGNRSLIFAVNHLKDTVSVINTATNTVINTIDVGNGPYGIAFDSTHKQDVRDQLE